MAMFNLGNMMGLSIEASTLARVNEILVVEDSGKFCTVLNGKDFYRVSVRKDLSRRQAQRLRFRLQRRVEVAKQLTAGTDALVATANAIQGMLKQRHELALARASAPVVNQFFYSVSNVSNVTENVRYICL